MTSTNTCNSASKYQRISKKESWSNQTRQSSEFCTKAWLSQSFLITATKRGSRWRTKTFCTCPWIRSSSMISSLTLSLMFSVTVRLTIAAATTIWFSSRLNLIVLRSFWLKQGRKKSALWSSFWLKSTCSWKYPTRAWSSRLLKLWYASVRKVRWSCPRKTSHWTSFS